MGKHTIPFGFQFAGAAAGIKASGKPDISLILGDASLTAAGVYTQNQVVAAPVVLCRQRTPSDSIRAVVTNSGNANACTGLQGETDATEMCKAVASHVGCDESEVLVMSTGIIGVPLPMDLVREGIAESTKALGTSDEHFESSADGILTTDKARKVRSREITIDGKPVRIAAMAKGAGMIAPNMATMLAVVMTDAVLSPDQASQLIFDAANASFNQVSVDGHTSTNDTLLLLASGASGVEIKDSSNESFTKTLNQVCIDLARELVADGEGAQHIMKICVTGAESDEDANTIARAIGESPLVKTAITGGDPNWGRIVSTAGYAGPTIHPRATTLSLQGTLIYENGAPLAFDASKLSSAMISAEEIEIRLTVGSGSGSATRWASDLTVEYVRFNSEYTT